MITANANNSIVTVTGLSKPADTAKDQKSWTTDVKYTDLACYIEQMDIKTTLIFAGEASAKMFLMIVPENLDISEGDKIVDNHSRTFTVQAVQSFVGDTDVPVHMEIQLVQRYPDN